MSVSPRAIVAMWDAGIFVPGDAAGMLLRHVLEAEPVSELHALTPRQRFLVCCLLQCAIETGEEVTHCAYTGVPPPGAPRTERR